MISIHFHEQIDCEIIYTQLKSYFEKYNDVGLKGRVESDGQIITIYYDNHTVDFYESFQPLLVNVFTKHVISMKEDEWLLDIIESMFYFEDYEEQNQILSIARSIIEGDHQDLSHFHNISSREKVIYQAFSKFIIEETNFYYESFLKFRLKEYYEQLIETVGLAIDEYLLEQEYQHMVENLRCYLKTSKPIFPVLHILHDQKFYFFNEDFHILEQKDIAAFYDEEIKFEEGLSIGQIVISPLVSLAPKKVHLYTDEIDHGVVQTIQNIFEERVTVFSKQDFSTKAGKNYKI
ncbi:putative sporulation protein YtxC [Anaerobacillus sp. MEB173]|uniref:putative sporulation protein YtxC n=1 Tax=Anaerobacillus sp. MEB173 TaxID=3383345 RepID=UPI003F906BD2